MNHHASLTSTTNKSGKTETCKAIIITIAGHLLAIPVSTVFKIVRSSLYKSSNLGSNKIVHLDEQTLPIIDLGNLLDEIEPSNNLEHDALASSDPEEFLVLAKSNHGNLSAVVVDEPPTLMDLPLQNTYLLPPNEQRKLNNIASHIAVVPFGQSNITIFLLDIEQALAATGFSNSIELA